MTKRALICTLAVLVVTTMAVAGEKAKSEKAKADDNAYVGWVTDTHCGAKGNNANHAGCAKSCVKGKDAKFALYTPADGKVYVLAPQDKGAAHAGQHVKVTGSLDGDTLTVASIEATGEQEGMAKEKKEKSKS